MSRSSPYGKANCIITAADDGDEAERTTADVSDGTAANRGANTRWNSEGVDSRDGGGGGIQTTVCCVQFLNTASFMSATVARMQVYFRLSILTFDSVSCTYTSRTRTSFGSLVSLALVQLCTFLASCSRVCCVVLKP